MISGYVLQGKGYLALKLFEEMLLQNVEPNEVTLSGALAACSNVGAMEEGKLIYDSVIRNGTLTTIISNTLVDMYGKFGLTEEAENVFKGFSDHNVISWGTLIAGYTMQSNGLKALDLYKKMLRDDIVPTKPVFLSTLQASALVGALEEGQLIHVQITESGYEADVVLGNTLIDMYAKCGKLHEACNVFASLESRDMVSWSAMMSGFIWNDKCKEVDRCFQSMQKHGLKAAQFIFTNILDACNHSGFLVEGLRYFRWMTQVHGFSPDLNHYSCMSDVLGRGGCLLEAIDLLHTMPKVPDIISWTSLLVSCRIHGNRKLASKCFQELLDREPNEGSWYVLISEIYGDYSYTSTETSLNPRDKCAYLYSLLGVNENFPHSVIKKALVDLP
jgi:pentatricopeptide repeat protein